MPFCKHCHNLGLETANTHWLRDSCGNNAKITCPVLLNTSCRFCKNKGHTISYCVNLKNKDKERVSNAIIEYKNISKQSNCFNNQFEQIEQNNKTILNDFELNQCEPMQID